MNEHIAELVQTCWRLGAEPSLAPLRLRQWAHMLGFRGHWSIAEWRYAGRGYRTVADAWLAASAAARAREQRQIAREELRAVARAA